MEGGLDVFLSVSTNEIWFQEAITASVRGDNSPDVGETPPEDVKELFG